ncbi:MAG TPA: hypothetical protein VFI42_20010 [Thermomicrobiaceae bacterium]|nr:hypothetical protein [Thermomicrobiaceae bacterium]
MRTHKHGIDIEMIRALVDTSTPSGEIEAIVARHVEPRPGGLGPDRARLRDSGVSIWLIIADLDATDGDIEQVIHDYDLHASEVIAAIYYYLRNPELIEARVALNEAGYAG